MYRGDEGVTLFVEMLAGPEVVEDVMMVVVVVVVEMIMMVVVRMPPKLVPASRRTSVSRPSSPGTPPAASTQPHQNVRSRDEHSAHSSTPQHTSSKAL
jgi:hypothetical protein